MKLTKNPILIVAYFMKKDQDLPEKIRIKTNKNSTIVILVVLVVKVILFVELSAAETCLAEKRQRPSVSCT